ncbi:M13-type metalloendopeptidase [Rehaibacterium terrae]|uniref:Putative endopeptidase n=1 Tax=Rehaibacterium terrae TaxID=1341696 RepID=A0A7W7Y0B9_9GAMM|nr:putative endopeptidase [Rehaibacterium terrae]
MNIRSLSPLALAVALALAGCSPAADNQQATTPARPAIDLSALKTPVSVLKASDLDPSVPACQDLNTHVNGKWLAANPVPADRSTWGSFELLAERSLEIQRALVEHAAATGEGGIERMIGDLWATGMDEAAINAAGIAPIQPMLDAIAALSTPEQVAAHIRDGFAQGQGFLFGFGPESDFRNPTMTIAYASQGGLGLPDRGYYLEDRADYIKAREAYLAHIARVLELSGIEADAAAAQAQQVMAFETRLARVSKSSEELSRDVSLYYNPVSLADADALTPNFPWSAFFQAQGIAAPAMFSLATPDFHKEVSAMLADTPVEVWQAYLRFHTVDNAAPFLSDAFAEENFNFYGKTLRGQQQMQPRWKRVLNAINAQAGEALGQLYVEVAFPPESKAKMEKLVDNLSQALKARLENLEWMGEETRAKALEKWAGFTPKIGYPDTWRDWSGLETSRAAYVTNLMAANAFNWKYQLAKIGQPVDPSEWQMSPQTVNAYYHPLRNEIVFPAAILQPPFFDPEADDALNYGGIGAVIGHEMIHGYDDQGSRFDAKGNFANWWTDKDRQGFEERTARLIEQFDGYESIDGIHVNGRLTLGENIADLGGLSVAYDAMRRAQGERFNDPMVEGFTQDQRFFMNWATVWRRNFKDEELKVRLTTDPHAPAPFRAIGAPSNMPAFAAAFGCESGDPMVREGDARVVIW